MTQQLCRDQLADVARADDDRRLRLTAVAGGLGPFRRLHKREVRAAVAVRRRDGGHARRPNARNTAVARLRPVSVRCGDAALAATRDATAHAAAARLRMLSPVS